MEMPTSALTGITLKDMFDAGLHFGHQTKRWNPKMKGYIFDKRNGIHIIDLNKTVALLDEAAQFWYRCTQEDGAVGYILSGASYSAMAGAWDTIWDCACDIRKVEA